MWNMKITINKINTDYEVYPNMSPDDNIFIKFVKKYLALKDSYNNLISLIKVIGDETNNLKIDNKNMIQNLNEYNIKENFIKSQFEKPKLYINRAKEIVNEIKEEKN